MARVRLKSHGVDAHLQIGLSSPVIPQTNYRYRSTDTPDMPADPLNGGGEGGESTGEILPATGSVGRNILIPNIYLK